MGVYGLSKSQRPVTLWVGQQAHGECRYAFTQDAVDLEDLRARLRKMNDEEVLAFGKSARYMRSPAANLGKPPREPVCHSALGSKGHSLSDASLILVGVHFRKEFQIQHPRRTQWSLKKEAPAWRKPNPAGFFVFTAARRKLSKLPLNSSANHP